MHEHQGYALSADGNPYLMPVVELKEMVRQADSPTASTVSRKGVAHFDGYPNNNRHKQAITRRRLGILNPGGPEDLPRFWREPVPMNHPPD